MGNAPARARGAGAALAARVGGSVVKVLGSAGRAADALVAGVATVLATKLTGCAGALGGGVRLVALVADTGVCKATACAGPPCGCDGMEGVDGALPPSGVLVAEGRGLLKRAQKALYLVCFSSESTGKGLTSNKTDCSCRLNHFTDVLTHYK